MVKKGGKRWARHRQGEPLPSMMPLNGQLRHSQAEHYVSTYMWGWAFRSALHDGYVASGGGADKKRKKRMMMMTKIRKSADFEQKAWAIAHGFEHGRFWQVVEIAPNSLKRLQNHSSQ